ncbi:MAG: right-handed parallel beta-helix repeat-containing protein, partial [Candidatus Omnitrophota bacterium]
AGIGIYTYCYWNCQSEVLIEGSDIYSNSGDGVNNVGYYYYSYIKANIRDNVLYNNNGDGIENYGYDDYSTTQTLDVDMYNNVIYSNAVHGVYCLRDSNALVSAKIGYNKIYDNQQNGIYCRINQASSWIKYNDIYENYQYGVYNNSPVSLEVNYNNIYNNNTYEFYNDTPNSVDGRNNWWGSVSTGEMSAGGNPKNITKFYDSYDNSAKGTIDYSQWSLNARLQVKVLSPDGGETWSGTKNILWKAEILGSAVSQVNIFYSNDAGSSWVVLAEAVSNTESYNWDTSLVSNGNQYLIKISSTYQEQTMEDTSDAVFAINN